MAMCKGIFWQDTEFSETQSTTLDPENYSKAITSAQPKATSSSFFADSQTDEKARRDYC